MQKQSDVRDHPVFICGHPKSGTTLLRALLDSHPQLVVYPDETFYFRGFLPEIRGLSFEEKLSLAQRYLLHFFNAPGNNLESNTIGHQTENPYQVYAETCVAMEKLLPQSAFRHNGDLLSAAILAFGEVHRLLENDNQYWVEKTPYNEHYAELVYSWWPEARCIHVVRDPRDNFATYHRKHPGLPVEEFATSWNASLKVGFQSQKQFGKETYLIIRYEDLTQQSENEIQKIIDFLKIKEDELLRKPTKNGVLWEGNSMFNDRFSGISSKPLGRWKSELKHEDVSIIETACRRGMEQLGYIPQGRPDIKSNLRIATWKCKQALKIPVEVAKLIKRNYGSLP
jgi:hypothetical protein